MSGTFIEAGFNGSKLVSEMSAAPVVTGTVETPEQVAGTIRAAMKYVAPEKLYPCTNCGMVPLARELAAAKLHALAAGAAIVRREIEQIAGFKPDHGAH